MRLVKAVLTFGVLTGLSRVFGLIREMLISRIMGASLVTDAFFVAFKFPNFFRRIFAEGAFSSVFVPRFSQILVSDGRDEARSFANATFSFLAFFLTAFVTVVVIFTPQIIHILAPGFVTTPERFELAVTFTRISFPYILFISLAAHLSGVLNSFDRFAAAAGTPILLNIVMIAALLSAPSLGMSYGVSLSVAVIIAGILQLGWLYIACRRMQFSIQLVRPKLTPEIKQLLQRMLPGALSAGVMNINLFIDMILASFLPERSISYLTYADRLNQLPLSMIGIAIGTALLPSLSRQLKAAELEKAKRSQLLAVEFSLQLSVPATIGLMMLSYPLINLIYGLPSLQTNAVSQALTALAAGIPAYVLNKVFSTCFFARQDTRTPAKIAVCSIILNFGLNLLLMWRYAHVGMAMATTLAAWGNVIILYLVLRHRDWFKITPELKTIMLKLVLIGFVMALALGLLEYYRTLYIVSSSFTELVYVGVSVLVGFSVFVCCSLCLKSLRLAELKQVLNR